jgi:hypothetical protein
MRTKLPIGKLLPSFQSLVLAGFDPVAEFEIKNGRF